MAFTATTSLYSLLLLFLLLKSPASATTEQPESATPATEVSPTVGTFLVFFVAVFFLAGVAFVAFRRILASRCWGLLRGGEAGGGTGGASLPCRVPDGLTREAIGAIPSYFYRDVKMHRGGSKGGLECAVCLSEFEDNEGLRLLPGCCHVFHPQCLDPWLISQATCPLCRSNLQLSGSDQRSGSNESGAPGGPLDHAIAIVPGSTVYPGLGRSCPAEPGEQTADTKPANPQANRQDRFTLTLPKGEMETPTYGRP